MEQMIADIEAEVSYTAGQTGCRELSDPVLAALRAVPRHVFVDDDMFDAAYDNRPLPIGHGQTISQPYMVAIMTELLQPRPHHRILEIGTGCGYQSAVLAQLVKEVVSLEIIPALAESARQRLDRLGYHNVTVIEADGHQGWPAGAPYDGIIVTAAPQQVPPALINQLAPGGHLIIPVGPQGWGQQLLDLEKQESGHTSERALLAVSFVPLID